MKRVRLSHNKSIPRVLADLAACKPPKELELCEVTLAPEDGQLLGEWLKGGTEVLNLRGNPSFGGDGVETMMGALVAEGAGPAPALRALRLDGCAIGDDGLEAVAAAMARGMELKELWVEQCEISRVGCELLAKALVKGERLETLSVRANVIYDEGCALLARSARRLDLSNTSLSGEILQLLEEQPLVKLEVHANPSLGRGAAVAAWLEGLSTSRLAALEYLDLSVCELGNASFDRVCQALISRPALLPSLSFLLLGGNDIDEDEGKMELTEKLMTSRSRLHVKWVGG